MACVQRLAGGPELPKQMAEMDRELRALQQQAHDSHILLHIPSVS